MLDTTAGRISLPRAYDIGEGQSLTLGIRPEHLHATDGGEITASVEVVEPMGNETHVTCLIDKDELRLIESADTALIPGQEVQLGFDANKAHLFDSVTEERLAERAVH
jgi:multiple sugar transport system ATP-binding protein